MSSNNSTREIPISETLENLLTDVEFEYSDVTLEESTTTSTVPAESNLTAVSSVEFRHVSGTRKRLSELSYSIGGADLRVKRRCLNNRQAVVCTLNVDPINSVNLNSTSTKADIFSFFGLTMDDRLTLDQGQLLYEMRLTEIKFVSSTTMPNSPRDGSCLIGSLNDQIENTEDHIMKGFANNCLQTFRTKVAKTGYNLLKSGRLCFSGDSALGGTIENWLEKMMLPTTFGDEIFLNAAANLFSSKICIFTAIKESAIENKTFGFYQVHPLQEPMNPPLYLFFYNESDFTVGHYESIFPADGKVPEFLKSDCEIVSNVGTEPAGTSVVTESNRIAKKRGRPKGSKNKNSSATSPKRSKNKDSSATSPIVNDISNDQSSTVDDVFEESNNR